MEKRLFGMLADGSEIYAFTLASDSVKITILNYGGRIQSILTHGRDVVCGFDTLDDYVNDNSYQGAIIGRYANRISNACFTLNGKEYKLAANDHEVNHNHGGISGFDRKVWTPAVEEKDGMESLVLTYTSPDGEEGYPGTLDVKVTYTLVGGSLAIHYEAVSDADTYVNLTNHSYFNLKGYDKGTIEDHMMTIYADRFTAVDLLRIPLGYTIDVVGTPFDFRKPKLIGQDIDVPNEQMGNIGGYGHNYWINGKKRETLFGRDLMVHAEASCEGLTLRVSSDMPCDQFYTSNILNGPIPFKGGVKQHKRQAICIEPQYEPDSPTYERTILRRGEKYDYMTVFTFESAE